MQCEYIRTEKVPANGLTATLFYLAEHKLINLLQVSGKKWTITGSAPAAAWADVDPVSLDVGAALKIVGPGTRFDANGTVAAGKKLSSAKTDMSAAVTKWAFDGFMVKRSKELWLRFFNVLALTLAACTFFWSPVTLRGVPFALFFGFSARSWTAGVGSRRTAAGANCGRRPAVSTGCCPPTRPSHASTSPPARTSTPPISRLPSPAGGRPVGPQVPDLHRRGRPATGVVPLVVGYQLACGHHRWC